MSNLHKRFHHSPKDAAAIHNLASYRPELLVIEVDEESHLGEFDREFDKKPCEKCRFSCDMCPYK